MSAASARRRPVEHETVDVDDDDAEPWPRGVSRDPKMKISEVVDRLKTEFPALSLSKVRYLEGRGSSPPTGWVTAIGGIPRPTWSGCGTP